MLNLGGFPASRNAWVHMASLEWHHSYDLESPSSELQDFWHGNKAMRQAPMVPTPTYTGTIMMNVEHNSFHIFRGKSCVALWLDWKIFKEKLPWFCLRLPNLAQMLGSNSLLGQAWPGDEGLLESGRISSVGNLPFLWMFCIQWQYSRL